MTIVAEPTHMTSIAKIRSNRRNARLSTGPKTREGKAASSKNAIRHGLLSKQVTLPDEDKEAFTCWSEKMLAQLAPVGPLEEFLAGRVVATAWRLGRVSRLESGVLAYRMMDVQVEQAGARREVDLVAAGLIRDAAGADTLSKLARYERNLERGMYRALHELQRLQASRSGQEVLPPAVVDVDVSSELTRAEGPSGTDWRRR